MSDRRRLTLLDDLPEEILVGQILIRLPSKDVGRCRAVSTSWRSATSTPGFMLEHHRRQPSLPFINGNCRPAYYVVFCNTGASASSQQLWPFLPGAQNSVQFSAACDGFLIVYHRRRSRFYICNPVTRKHALLALPQVGKDISNNVIGFYRHHPTGEYRVLCVSMSQQQIFSKYSLYNLTVGSDESRHVTVTMPAVSSPSVEQKLLLELGFLLPPPVKHSGSLHWCRDYAASHTDYAASHTSEGGRDIIVFDTEAESFRWMRCPAQLCTKRKLFNMKGALASWGSSTPSFTDINVWVMQDYEAEIWAFKYRIDLSTVEVSRQLYLTSVKNKNKKKTPVDSTVEVFNDMAVLNERELLIKFNKKHVLRCDIDGKFLGIVKIGQNQYCMALTQHRIQESIIPFPGQELQGEDEEPPFPIGHV